jgi:hypothetical protein
VATAKEYVLKYGNHPPVLFVHGQKKKIFFELSTGATHQERIEVMTRSAIRLAKNEDLGELESVVFVCEAWASRPARLWSCHRMTPIAKRYW